MTCVCEQCGYRWESRGTPEDSNARPGRCPQCMTTAWDRAKRKAGRPRKKPPEQPGLVGLLEADPGADLTRTDNHSIPRPPTMCPHNRPVGAHCWQCKGIAVGEA